MRYILLAITLSLLSSFSLADGLIKKMTVRGNAKVESEAILTILSSQEGTVLSKEAVQADILSLYNLGFFSDVRFYKETTSEGLHVIIEVKEKPAVVAITYTGLEEIGEDEFKDKMETELYTIVDEGAITSDLRIIEKAYLEKGFYLAKASYKLVPVEGNPQQVEVEFVVEEGGKVLVGDVHILGNEYFSDSDLIDQFFLSPTPGIQRFPHLVLCITTTF